MIQGAKQQENKMIGESYTEHVLSKFFWYLKRSVDIDGADYLVQLRDSSNDVLRDSQKKGIITGIVQSKFFENSNQVKIQKSYVLDLGKPRNDFFAFLVTLNPDDGKTIYFFFTAEQIHKTFKISKNGKYYTFSLSNGVDYKSYKDIIDIEIKAAITDGINNTEIERNALFIDFISNDHILSELVGNLDYPESVTRRTLNLLKSFDIEICNTIKKLRSLCIEIDNRFYLISFNSIWLRLDGVVSLRLPFAPDEIIVGDMMGESNLINGYTIENDRIEKSSNSNPFENVTYLNKLILKKDSKSYYFPLVELGGNLLYSLDDPKLAIEVLPNGSSQPDIWSRDKIYNSFYPIQNNFYCQFLTNEEIELIYELGLVLEKSIMISDFPKKIKIDSEEVVIDKKYSFEIIPLSSIGNEICSFTEPMENKRFSDYLNTIIRESINNSDDGSKFPFPISV